MFILTFSLSSHYPEAPEHLTPSQLATLYHLLQQHLFKPSSNLHHADPSLLAPPIAPRNSYLKGRSAVDVQYEQAMRQQEKMLEKHGIGLSESTRAARKRRRIIQRPKNDYI